MWRILIPVILTLASCGNSQTPRRPASNDDGGQVLGTTCESVEGKVKSLYAKAAVSEEVAQNLVTEYLAANVHMVMSDCRAQKDHVLPCLTQVKSVRDLEANCLLLLDEEGMVEHEAFSQP